MSPFCLRCSLPQAKCFVCHKFRCNRLKLKLLLTKLRLLDAGLLLLAKSVDEIALKSFNISVGPDGEEKKGNSSRLGASSGGSKKKKKSKDGDEEEDEVTDEPLEDQSDAVKNRLDELLALAETNIRKYGRVVASKKDDASKKKKHSSSSSKAKKEPGVAREPTSHELSYRREVVASFFHEIQSKKCHSCGAFSPQLRRDGHTKIFRLPLTRVQQQSMDLLNLRFDDVLALSEGGFEKGSETWAKMMRERNFHREYQAILRKKKDEKKALTLAARKRKEKLKEKKNDRARAEKAEDDLDGAAAEDDEEGGSDAEVDDTKDDDASASDDDADSDAESSGADDGEVAPKATKSLKAAAGEKTDKADKAAGSAKKSKGPKKSDAAAAAAAAAMSIDSEEELDDGKKVLIKLADDEEDESKRVPILMFPNEVEKHVEFLWKQEADVLSTLWGSMCDLLQHDDGESSSAGANQHYTAPLNNHRMFFLRVLCVPPSRFRPPTRFGDMLVDHPQNVYFKHILEMDVKLQKMQRGEKILKFEPKEPARKTPSKAKLAAPEEEEKKEEVTLDLNLLITTWIALQTEINLLLDSTKGGQIAGNAQVVPGIRQTFEKKEGLFRRNMMGKRVNFAARSVISPDPFINTNEIGVPELFATQLSYPEPVTPFNVATLRQAVINGPKIHPGANFVEDERGNLIDLAQRSYPQRVALSKTLLTTGLYDSARNKSRSSALTSGVSVGQKRVLRHIRTGDVMIVNRQPTLHKPSMMTHKVRVMRGKASKTQMKSAMWQTIRMHYANCN